MNANMPSFTAHNIQLDDGTSTKPEIGFPMHHYPSFVSAKRLLSVIYPGPRDSVRLVDLGCLEGGYSVEFARMGFDVLGMEIRESNFDACTFVKQKTNLPNLNFVRDNAWNIAKYGQFDIIFCCGLFYHLDRPAEFLRLIASCTSKLLILQTHFATDTPNQKYRLSDSLSQDDNGYQGRWVIEFENDAAFTNRELARWSSWDNKSSFWLKREHLLQAIVDSGFDICIEQFDNLGDISSSMESGHYITDSRGTFVGIKSGIDASSTGSVEAVSKTKVWARSLASRLRRVVPVRTSAV